MKLLVLTRSKNNYAQRRLQEEAQKRKIEIGVFNYSHLCFSLEPDTCKITSSTGENLANYDLVTLRSPGLKKRYLWQERVLVKFLAEKNKRILNKESFLRFQGDFDKLLQQWVFFQQGLPFVKTVNFGSTQVFPQQFKYPVVFKKIFGALGWDFNLINNKAGLAKFLTEENPYEFLQQPFLTTGEDFRVIVLGRRVLGAMKRVAAKGQVVTNVTAGGRAQKTKLTKELKNLALKASQALNCELAGVDVMYNKKGNPFILEVNRYPGFKGFERVIGINVAGEVIDYLINKL